MINTLINDDCFNVLPKIKEHSVDLVLVDLPYAQTSCSWDIAISLEQMWKELKRCCTKKCMYVFFTTTKFGVSLINSNPKWFRYDLCWEKSKKVGFLNANNQPLRKHEMIYVFGANGVGKKSYNPQKTEGKPYTWESKRTNHEIYGQVEDTPIVNTGDRHPTSIVQFEPDHEMVYVFGANGVGTKTYNPQKVPGKPFTDKRTSENKTGIYGDKKFVVQENTGTRHPVSIIKFEPKIRGGKYNDSPYGDFKSTPPKKSDTLHPSTILKFKNPPKPVHRTQKPVDLCEWLINSYSNKGDLVLDFTCGSGTTGVAAINTGRNWICVEKDTDIYNIAKKRIDLNTNTTN